MQTFCGSGDLTALDNAKTKFTKVVAKSDIYFDELIIDFLENHVKVVDKYIDAVPVARRLRRPCAAHAVCPGPRRALVSCTHRLLTASYIILIDTYTSVLIGPVAANDHP